MVWCQNNCLSDLGDDSLIITKELILKDYNKLKFLALKALKKGKHNEAAFYVTKAASLMYNSNIIYKDDDLEKILNEMNEKLFSEETKIIRLENSKKIVFYDYFVLDNRGLTEQYLDALINLDYEILFIGCQKSEKSTEIYKKLERYNIRNIVIKETDFIKKTQIVEKLISDFSPSKILAHTSPWDISGLVAIKHFDGICKRYLINITDHAFWLGVSVFDYFFEFRNYGYNISCIYRGISKEKLLLLPYYPIINKDISFQGFNFKTKQKKLILSGGSVYKLQGSDKFLKIVKHILDTYNDTIFLFLGNGDFSIFKNFVKKNNFQNCFFYEKERKDIFEVFKHCYFYLNTYPLCGGLMTQYACVAGKIPLTLNDENEHSDNDVSELLFGENKKKVQFSSFEELINKIDWYIRNPRELEIDSKNINNVIITSEKFTNYLKEYLELSKNQIRFVTYDIDINKFMEQYISRFNESKMTYYSIFMDRKFRTLNTFLIYFLRYFICKICRWAKRNI